MQCIMGITSREEKRAFHPNVEEGGIEGTYIIQEIARRGHLAGGDDLDGGAHQETFPKAVELLHLINSTLVEGAEGGENQARVQKRGGIRRV